MENKISIESLLQGDRRTLSKAITQIESTLAEDIQNARTLIEESLPHAGKSVRIGLSGSPGAGKSSLIEALGLHILKESKSKIAVLTIDPSSPVHGGSILGDKTRMEELSQSDRVFIRPSPSAGVLGGVGRKTREAILLCEAAGYDIILIETVGVGQSEVDVASMVDLFLVLQIPNSGDDVQGIKKGIIELADLIVISKADGDSEDAAIKSQQLLTGALELTQHSDFWKTEAILTSIKKPASIQQLWATINKFFTKSRSSGHFDRNRSEQSINSIWHVTIEMIHELIKTNSDLSMDFESMKDQVSKGLLSPFGAAREIINRISISNKE